MLKFIPFPAQAGITGFESPAAEYTHGSLDLNQLLIKHPAATYIGYAEGRSMVGAGIHSGDLLIISRAETIRNGDVIVANLNGTFVCKLIDRPNKTLRSASSGHAAYAIRDGDEFQIEGVVICSIRLHRPINRVL